MEEVTEKELTIKFASLMNGFIGSPSVSPKVILDALVNQFRSFRIQGVQDKLQFGWGANNPHKLTQFADLRTEEFEGWDDDELLWIGVTRELPLTGEDDDTALHCFIYFGSAGIYETSGTVVCQLENLDARYAKFLSVTRVKELLDQIPSRINAFACEVG